VSRRRGQVAAVVYFLGGGALLASSLLHWVAHGPGSGLRGHELIDAIVGLGRHVPALSAARLTVVWYLVPALGAVSWIVLGWRGVRSRSALVVAVVALVAALLAVGAFIRLVGVGDLGPGGWIAAIGALLLTVASGVASTERAHGSQ
jgi:hypothetical protein